MTSASPLHAEIYPTGAPGAAGDESRDSGQSSSLDGLLDGLRAAGEPTRLRLLALLAKSELTVTELTQILGQSQPRVSRHLKLMAGAGLIDRFREGTWVFYRLGDRGAGAALARALLRLLPPDDQGLVRDLDGLAAITRARGEAANAYFAANAADWDRIRSLHVPEAQVEAALLDLAGSDPVDEFLDIGTGTGRILALLGPRARRGLGLDLSHEMLSMARATLDAAGLRQCQVRHGDMYRMPLNPGQIDLAVMHQVLHFAHDPALAMAEIARVLAPGGRALIADFAPHDLEHLRDVHAHRRLGFTEAEVVGWCRAAGLEARLARQLAGDPLTVSIWVATKPVGQPASAARDLP
jgi:ubiquinone/menaquinone biosynthesis C-methylase UbiE/DNA-binding transcriptional ArsR family regulator